ncbi:hypothetical protein DE4585_01578 [Mycobacteroides salmoniphilum]|uniref:Lipoprotein n=1 Tax=Mycobacteroides salmoniphilum TaxID=404941 RepID=A0A4R8S0R9_9MYCO|nr:hypothetical protein [Mycobacteroides salmoniphilum]TDZ75218.1 hypothetical protein DE4586_03108 [Mycobacteroides salmoniphilum]TDZ82786.1 hypothetical protein DE4585_01578 [Mycobacteroides salmoniphilum]TDZ83736.1 hypothetical protein DE4587_02649 [Mycobacteroides salmoniphilum]
MKSKLSIAVTLASALMLSGCGTSFREAMEKVNPPSPQCMREAFYTSNVTDQASFVDRAQNVFVGKVKKEAGQHIEKRDIYTLFKVEVVKNIKGNLSGEVNVAQVGGRVDGRECLQNSDPLLSTDSVYVFVTKHSPNIDMHFIAASGYGDIPLTGEEAVAVANNGTDPEAIAEIKDALKSPPPAK